jgi:acid phosphatase type 7
VKSFAFTLKSGRSFSFLAALLCVAIGLLSAAGENASSSAPDSKPTLSFKQFQPGQPLHLVAYGDMRFTNPSVTEGTNPRVRQWLADRIGQLAPQALLLTGDMPFTGADPADWAEFQRETASWRRANVLQLPAPGNHEIKGGAKAGLANYLENFPEIGGHLYYSAVLGNVEVISLDLNAPAQPTDPQPRWFAAQLDHLPRQVEFLFILHHMPWMADAQTRLLVELPSSKSLVLRNILESRIGRIHARVVVFNGHIHNYERFERRGIEYVITGGGGAEPYPILLRGRADLYRDTGFPVYHYLTLDIAAHKLHAVMWKVKDPNAASMSVEAKDEFTLTAAPQPETPKTDKQEKP